MTSNFVGFDTAEAITSNTLDQAIANGCRYVELYTKWATPALVQLVLSKGLGIGLIWETTAERALSGYAGGMADAHTLLDQIPTKLGVMPPMNVAVAWTADFDATPGQQPTVLDYGRGFRAGLNGALRTRCYANGAVCKAAKALKIVDYTWVAGGRGMTGTAAFLQTGQEDEYQDVNDKQGLGLPISIDSDVAVGQDRSWLWTKDGTAPVPAVQPIPAFVGVLQQGSTGDLVAEMQEYLGIPDDGIFGPMTAATVKSVQHAHGLVVDGIVGAKTAPFVGLA